MSVAPPAWLVVGRIGRPHGVRGELQVDVLTDFPERFDPGARLHLGPEDLDPEGGEAPEPVRVLGSRPHGRRLLVLFEGIADREAAAWLTGKLLYIPIEEAGALPEDSYYAHQLIGLAVETDAGLPVGRVVDLMETGSADILVIAAPDGARHLVPLNAELVPQIDLAAGRITVKPIPGLLD